MIDNSLKLGRAPSHCLLAQDAEGGAVALEVERLSIGALTGKCTLKKSLSGFIKLQSAYHY